VIHFDPILAADKAEETSALAQLGRAQTKDELVTIWWTSCGHFLEGTPARKRLQDAYRDRLRQLGALAP